MSAPSKPAYHSSADHESWLDQIADHFERAWRSGKPPDLVHFLPSEPARRLPALIELVHIDLERRLKAGERVRIESYLERFPELARAPAGVLDLVKAEYAQRRQAEPDLGWAEYLQRFPQYHQQLQQVLADQSTQAPVDSPDSNSDKAGGVSGNAQELPTRLGRYRITARLGSGGFGVVYKGHDEELRRDVAIKVPHRYRLVNASDAEVYLAEARVLASLDHPHIVPVHDVGRTEDGTCFIVSKFIAGSDLAKRLASARPGFAEATNLVATVAEALHHVHKRGLVHRDIKPANILLDEAGQPFVTDFGLALREDDFGQGPQVAGTPAYMSPEQARREGHRVDGRSDIFSLGVVFYELLTGRRPFRGKTAMELLVQISSDEVRPPRQIDDAIPKELERTCLKALAKRATERYTTARDFADDLKHFLAQGTPEDERRPAPGAPAAASPLPVTTDLPSLGPTPASDQTPLKVMPKGLRSFDAHDADFFLELLPGPRDRNGLPDSIRFWKGHIEETDADNTFAVGLMYGPSGCGKSSLVKAGLLPRLSSDVLAVYIEATAQETEARLLNGLRKKCPALPTHLGLNETLQALRRGQGVPAGKKVLIVLDQFEQWLHAKKEEENTELVAALRQCDGGRVQCIVLVRDDFWMAVTRFVGELEAELVPGKNVAAVDLFEPRHARKVLAAFGRAFGALPEEARAVTREQQEFLDQAVASLAQEGKVVCVRLALFAEMMKGRTWTVAALKEVGGAQGVGVAFLEETFSSPSANPRHRLHQKAARAVLQALLPESGTDIKGHMRSHAELLAASGMSSRPSEFDDLLHILDSDIRLITPTDPEGQRADADSSSKVQAGEKYYQLTHDYLVPSLRDWLTRKQKETRRGRAELRLAERAALWNRKPQSRQLPAWWEWANIRLFTRRNDWMASQRKMMRQATRFHAARGVALLLLLVAVTVAGLEVRGRVIAQNQATRAAGLVRGLLDADIGQVPGIITEIEPYRTWADPLLQREDASAGPDSHQKLHASLALLPVDATRVQYLYGRLLAARPQEVPVIRDALATHKDALLNKLWTVVEIPEKGQEPQRLRAAAALANYDPESAKWAKGSSLVVHDLVLENPVFLGLWSEAFRPVKHALLAPLADIFRDQRPERAAERMLATNLLADYAADNPQTLADLVMDADEMQFAVIYPKLKDRGAQGLTVLTGEIDKKLPSDLPSSDEKREKLAKRQANAGVALLRMNQPAKVWPLLKHSPDPRVRSYLIHRLSPLGADAAAIIKRLDEEPDITIRRALMLSLGEYGESELPPGARQALLPKLQSLYRTDSDPGLHGATEWLLRTWKQDAWLKHVNDEWAKDKGQREKWLPKPISPQVSPGQRADPREGDRGTKDKERAPQWYVNGQGQTMVVILGPLEFVMGSPPTEAGRVDNEPQHEKRIGRIFALSAKAVTVGQYRRFNPGYSGIEEWAPTADCPVIGTNWFQAAEYCNWLSKQEGLPEREWCYEPLPIRPALAALSASSLGLLGSPPGPLLATCGLFPRRTDPEYKDGMKLAVNYLKRTGYRLPTEAEIEVATRAGSVTCRYFGETADLLTKYAWFLTNSRERTWPGGSLKPNDLGLFDMQGNVWMWCQDNYKNYPSNGKKSEDREDPLVVIGTRSRVMRGGSFCNHASSVRSAVRGNYVPTARYDGSVGFRLARTLPLDNPGKGLSAGSERLD